MTDPACDAVVDLLRPDPQPRRRFVDPSFVALLRFVRPHAAFLGLTGLFTALGFALSFAYPWIIGSVVDLATVGGNGDLTGREAALVKWTVLAGITALVHAVVVYGRGHSNVHLGNRVVTDIRQRVFDHLQKLSVKFFANERTGAILARVLTDVDEAPKLLYSGLIVVGMDAVQLVLAFVLLVRISAKLTLACALVLPLYALVFVATGPRVRAASERVRAHFSRLSGNVGEQLSGQALVKTYAAETREAKRFAEDLAVHHELVVGESREGHLVAAAGEVLVHVGTTIVVGYGGWLALRGQISAGTMTRFLGYVLVMYGPVRRFSELNMTYQSSLAAMRRVFQLLRVRPAVAEPATPCQVRPTRGHLHFKRVRFRYAEDGDEARARLDADASAEPEERDRPWILRDVELDIRPGEQVAIVGRSGAGKSTLIALALRLYDVTDGHVLVDGVDVRGYSLATLRSAIAVVQQDTFLFTGTLRDNIAYGRPSATDEEIERAAVAADAHEFIAQLPKGYGARLGERGCNLSGGQRQRISLARALLKDPAILLLDEATSALDTESEAIVQQALEKATRGRTCLIVAHRLSTVRKADRICVLDGGLVVESGTHAELVALGGAYAELVENQTHLA